MSREVRTNYGTYTVDTSCAERGTYSCNACSGDDYDWKQIEPGNILILLKCGHMVVVLR